MLIDHKSLQDLVETIFAHAGSAPREAEILAGHLIEANLMGHDSHGVIRIAPYLAWLAAGQVKANRHARVVTDFGALLGVEGDGGYGLVIAGEAMDLAIAKARKDGAAILALRDCSHLGRIGAWAEQAAAAGFVSLHFVNTSGFGIHVAPHGGRDRRLSANPIAAGVPVPDGPPIILDMATSTVARGKERAASGADCSSSTRTAFPASVRRWSSSFPTPRPECARSDCAEESAVRPSGASTVGSTSEKR